MYWCTARWKRSPNIYWTLWSGQYSNRTFCTDKTMKAFAYIQPVLRFFPWQAFLKIPKWKKSHNNSQQKVVQNCIYWQTFRPCSLIYRLLEPWLRRYTSYNFDVAFLDFKGIITSTFLKCVICAIKPCTYFKLTIDELVFRLATSNGGKLLDKTIAIDRRVRTIFLEKNITRSLGEPISFQFLIDLWFNW